MNSHYRLDSWCRPFLLEIHVWVRGISTTSSLQNFRGSRERIFLVQSVKSGMSWFRYSTSALRSCGSSWRPVDHGPVRLPSRSLMLLGLCDSWARGSLSSPLLTCIPIHQDLLPSNSSDKQIFKNQRLPPMTSIYSPPTNSLYLPRWTDLSI